MFGATTLIAGVQFRDGLSVFGKSKLHEEEHSEGVSLLLGLLDGVGHAWLPIIVLSAILLFASVVALAFFYLTQKNGNSMGGGDNFLVSQKALDSLSQMVLYRNVQGDVVGGNVFYYNVVSFMNDMVTDVADDDALSVYSRYPYLLGQRADWYKFTDAPEPVKSNVNSIDNRYVFETVVVPRGKDAAPDGVMVELVRDITRESEVGLLSSRFDFCMGLLHNLWTKKLISKNGDVSLDHLLDKALGWYNGRFAIVWEVCENQCDSITFKPCIASPGVTHLLPFSVPTTGMGLSRENGFVQMVQTATQIEDVFVKEHCFLTAFDLPFDADWHGNALFAVLKDLQEHTVGLLLVLGSSQSESEFAQGEHFFRQHMGQLFDLALKQRDNLDERLLLLENKVNLERMLDNLPGMVFSAKCLPQLEMLFVSDGCFDITGYTADEMLDNHGALFDRLIDPDDKPGVWRHMQQSILNNESFQLNFRVLARNCSLKWVWLKGNFIGYHTDGSMLVDCLVLDVTEKIETDNRLSQHQIFVDTLVGTLPYIVFRLDRRGVILPTYLKSDNRDHTAFSFDQYVGKHYADILPARSAVILAKKMAELSQSKQTVLFEYELALLGQPVWHEARMVQTDNDEVLVFSADITERKLTESKIAFSESLFRAQFDCGSIAIGIMNVDLAFSLINPMLSTLLGYSIEELGQLTWFDISVPEDLDYDRHVFNRLTNGELVSYQGDKRLIRKDGNPVYSHFTLVMFNNEYLNSQQFIASFIDISERMGVERKILGAIMDTEERERMRIARDIHDGLGPILSSVKMYVQWMQLDGAKASKGELLSDMEKLVDHAHQTVREISFNLSPHLLQNYGLVVAVQSFINKVSEVARFKVAFDAAGLTERLSEEVEVVLYRAITECLNNTIKYAAASAVDVTVKKSNDVLQVVYRDDGVGFDVGEVLAQKSGLGLFNMQSRLKAINGNVEFVSAKGKGLTVNILIHL